MKAYIQYLDYDLAGKLSEPCGDRSVIILDGRNNLQTWIQIAKENNGVRRPLFAGFTIQQGDFINSREIYKELFKG